MTTTNDDERALHELRRVHIKMKASAADQARYTETLETMVLTITAAIIAWAAPSAVPVRDDDIIVEVLEHLSSTSVNQQTRDAAREQLEQLGRARE